MKFFLDKIIIVLSAFSFSACSFQQKDYSNFRTYLPKSILILPPLNETTAMNAEYKFLPTITRAIAERGYYVFPLSLVDQIFKENGVVSPIEMRQVPRDKLREIFGADALLDIKIKSWGTKYLIITSQTEVEFEYELIDLGSGISLWTDFIHVDDQQNNRSNNNALGGLIGSIVHALASNLYDAEPGLALQANQQAAIGLLNGPRWKVVHE